jgi:hypothetical protein
MSATAGAMDQPARRHRFVAIGLGFCRLAATKALTHAEMNITDALVFLTRFIAQCTSRVAHQTSCWHQAILAIVAIAATSGPLIGLYISVFRKRAFRHRTTQHSATHVLSNDAVTPIYVKPDAAAVYGLEG